MALSHSATHSNNYAVVLGEVDGSRKLPIVIGGFEAQAIAVAMEDMEPNRPLTHDLFKNTMMTFQVSVQEVIISELVDGIFHALLICERDGDYYEIDSRTSDAIAMAVRFNCPIYTYDSILEEAGIVMDEETEAATQEGKAPARPARTAKKSKSITDMPIDELQKLLDESLSKEDYERAAKIRDEINKRES